MMAVEESPARMIQRRSEMGINMAGLVSKYIVPGCRVDLQMIAHSRSEAEAKPGKAYQSQVLDVLSEDRIILAMPQEKAKLVLLPVGGEYDLYFYGDNVLYQCYARVTERYKDNNQHVLSMELTSNLRKYQRREYYRFSCALEMKSRELEQEEVDSASLPEITDSRELQLKGSIIVDISGGGLRFVADYAYQEQSLILCKYRLMLNGRSKEYSLVGRVLSVKELENRKGVFEHRVQYINVDAEEREEIIKYIFDEERKTIKNRREK